MAQSTVDHVFMSYSRRDEAVMQRVATFLRKQGINVWVDNEKLVPGTPIWEAEIEQAIKSASAVVVILTPDSKNSEWVRREITLADQNSKRVFPVLVRGDEASSITLRLIATQYVDIRENEKVGLNALSVALSYHIEEERYKTLTSTRKVVETSLQQADIPSVRPGNRTSIGQIFNLYPYLKWIMGIGVLMAIGVTIPFIWWILNNVIPSDPPEETITPAPTELTDSLPPATELPATEPPAPQPLEIGTADHPIKILFVPSVDAQVIADGGEILADALNNATGYYFEVVIPTSYAATIEEMCASTSDSMGFLPSLGYAIASQLCDVDVSFAAVRFGYPVYWSEILVPRNSAIFSLADLNGLRWGIPDQGSPSGYMVPSVMFQEAGIRPGEVVETGGHLQAALAVYSGQVDFATVFYSVPLNPEGVSAWTYEDYTENRVTSGMWDIPAASVPNCAPTQEGRLLCDGWRVLDARANIREEAPDVIQQIRILQLSPAIPNDTVSFGPEFPVDVRTQIEQALVNFSQTESWGESIGSSDFYGWTGLYPMTDSDFDFTRKMVETAGMTLENFR